MVGGSARERGTRPPRADQPGLRDAEPGGSVDCGQKHQRQACGGWDGSLVQKLSFGEGLDLGADECAGQHTTSVFLEKK